MNNNSTEKSKSSIRLSGRLKTFMLWPVIVALLLIVMNGIVYWRDTDIGLIVSGFVGVYLVLCLVLMFVYRPAIIQNLIDFGTEYSRIQGDLVDELSVPYALLDDAGHIIWMNQEFARVTDKDKRYRKHICTIFPEIKKINFPENESSYIVASSVNERFYNVELKFVSIGDLAVNSDTVELDSNSGIVAVYLHDTTELIEYAQRIQDEGFVAGLIYIDNYEETFESIDDVRRSLFAGLIDRRVNKYFTNGAGIVRKLEKDKYLTIFRYKYLEQLKADKFSLLDEIKEINIGSDLLVTASLGIATGGKDYATTFEMARTAIDLALGRGGDQVVIKDGEKVIYFGGKSQQVDKNTKVKARAKAHALKHMLASKDQIFIMGHNMGDVDSFGSAIGLYRAAKQIDKPAHIIVNDVTTSLKPFMEKFVTNAAYDKDMFLTSEQAIEKFTDNSAVIVTDVNKAERTECPELLEMSKTVVVIDHHRQADDSIKTAVLSYVEPYASSASEMVAEIIQYFDDNLKLKAIEADAMYAGILIDTDFFNNKCGVRTFEASAYLRRNGADTTRVRKMLRGDINEYRAKAEAVSNMQVYKDAFAITVAACEGVKSPTIVAAQVANELLDIVGIKATFVVTEYNDKIYISARSIDEVNVQLVMEKLGGGGHLSVAGAQLTGCTTGQAVQTIKVTLDKMISEGEI